MFTRFFTNDGENTLLYVFIPGSFCEHKARAYGLKLEEIALLQGTAP